MDVKFLRGARGFYRLANVESAQFKKNDCYEIRIAGQIVDECLGFPDVIASVIPPQGDWECLTLCAADNDHAEEVLVDPIIAWGVTVSGALRPITPSEPEGVEGDDFVTRKVGAQRVYGSGNIGGWSDMDAWRRHRATTRKTLAGLFPASTDPLPAK
jgi:hypothetical protein